MDPRQGLGQIAVALIGHDDARTGLRDEKIGAGDADFGSKETRSQHRTRLVTHLARLDQQPVRVERAMLGPECVGDLFLNQMDRRCDDVARRLMPQLDDVFAEIGFDGSNAVRLEEIVEPHLLGDHRLALRDELGARRAANLQHRGARLLGGARPMHLAAGSLDLAFVQLKVEVEVLESVILDRAAGFAQRLELRQPLDSQTTPQWKPGSRQTQRALQILVSQTSLGCGLKIAAGREHPRYRGAPMGGTRSVMPASTSATWRTSTCRPCR